jgi:uncharacterized membrane protein
MSQLIVVSFEQEETATQALEALRSVQHEGGADIKDAAVIRKDPDGKSHVKGTLEGTTVGGAVIGGSLGLILFLFFPVLGLAVGAIAGGLIGHAVGDHIDKAFVKDVTEKLDAGHSALFVLLGEGSYDAILSVLRPIQGGTLIQTTLDPELEEQVREAVN